MKNLILLTIGLIMVTLSRAQLKVTDIRFDSTITGFHFAANMSGSYVYTPNGASDLQTVNPTAFSFSVLPKCTYQEAMRQIIFMFDMAKKNGYIHADLSTTDTVVNGHKVFFMTVTETQPGSSYKNLIFHGFHLLENATVLFISGDLSNGKYRDKFRKTFLTTQF